MTRAIPHDDGCQEQEDNNWRACYAAAASRAGYSLEEADECHDGDLQCPSCPWIRCALCGGNAGTLNEEGTHNLCRALAPPLRGGIGAAPSRTASSSRDRPDPVWTSTSAPRRSSVPSTLCSRRFLHNGGTGVEPGCC